MLLGLIRGDVVHEWAGRVIASEANPPSPFIDIVSVPTDDLSEMRHALWPLVTDPPPLEVLHAVLGLAYRQFANGQRSLEDTVTIARQLRSMVKLPKDLYDAINSALVAHGSLAPQADFGGWLRQFEPYSI